MRSYTVAIIKPDGVREKLIGPILNMADQADLYPIDMYFLSFPRRSIDLFYKEHVGKDFFEAHAEFMMSGPSLAILFALDDGPLAASLWRAVMGVTDPRKARIEEHRDYIESRSIRARWGKGLPYNVVHGSDSEESAVREARILGLDSDRWK